MRRKAKPSGSLPLLTSRFGGFVGPAGLNPFLAMSVNRLFPWDCGARDAYPVMCCSILQQHSVVEARSVAVGPEGMSGMSRRLGDVNASMAAIESTARDSRGIRGINCSVLDRDEYLPDKAATYALGGRSDSLGARNWRLRLKRVEKMVLVKTSQCSSLDGPKREGQKQCQSF